MVTSWYHVFIGKPIKEYKLSLRTYCNHHLSKKIIAILMLYSFHLKFNKRKKILVKVL